MPQSRLIDADLEDQLASLRNELATLKRIVARGGSSLYEDAGETISGYWSELGNRIGPSLAGLRRQARTVERVAYDHPAVIATVGLVVIGLVASLLISTRPAAKPSQARAERSEAGSNGQAGRRVKRSRSSARQSG